ncbi:MAG: hypothetical protein ACRDN0_23475, partial [Trebonia sp.]
LGHGPLRHGPLRHGPLSHGRAGLTALLGATATGYLAVLGYSVSQPSLPPQNQALAGFLAAHDLTSGIGRYWAANITTAISDWHVRVIPAQPAPSDPYPWLTRPSWYDPAENYANFVVAGDSPGSSTYPVQDVLSAFGQPAREYRFDGYVIMVYHRNLLRDMQPPVQPNPDLGSRLLPGYPCYLDTRPGVPPSADVPDKSLFAAYSRRTVRLLRRVRPVQLPVCGTNGGLVHRKWPVIMENAPPIYPAGYFPASFPAVSGRLARSLCRDNPLGPDAPSPRNGSGPDAPTTRNGEMGRRCRTC